MVKNSLYGLGDGTYSTVITYAPWVDESGGGITQIAITGHGNKVKRRLGNLTNNTWGPWVEILDSTMINVPWGIAGLDGNGKIYEAFMPSVPKIVNVNYVGDGTNGRFIDCGFVPKFAIVETQYASTKKFLIGWQGTTSFNGTSISTWNSKLSSTGVTLVSGANGPNDAGYNHILTCFG